MTPMTIAEFGAKILAHHAAKDHAPSTIRQARQVLGELAEAGILDVAGLTTEGIAAWKAIRPARTPVTLRSHLRCLKSMCRRARRHGWIDVDPFDIDPIGEWVRDDAPTARPRRRWSLSPAEVRRVLETADREAQGGDWMAGRLRAYIWSLLLLGLRPGELQRLEVADVDLAGRTISIHPKEVPVRGGRMRWWRPKSVGSAATIPCGDRLAGVLADWIPLVGCGWLFPGSKRRGPWTCGGPGVRPLDHVKGLGLRAGVRLWQKSGRKSVGTHSAGAGLTSIERQGLFRHADEETGRAYDEADVDGLRPAAAKLERYYFGAAS